MICFNQASTLQGGHWSVWSTRAYRNIITPCVTGQRAIDGNGQHVCVTSIQWAIIVQQLGQRRMRANMPWWWIQGALLWATVELHLSPEVPAIHLSQLLVDRTARTTTSSNSPGRRSTLMDCTMHMHARPAAGPSLALFCFQSAT